MHSRHVSVLLATAAFLAAGCDAGSFLETDGPGTDHSPEASEIRLEPLPSMITEGDTVILTGSVLDRDGRDIPDADLRWDVDDESVAAVEPTGKTAGRLVTHRPGSTTLTVSYESLSASTTIEVHNRPVDLVYVSGSGQEGAPGETLAGALQLRAIDRRGDPVSGVAVGFTVMAGGGSVAPSSGTTDAEGRVSATWTLGASGAQSVRAKATEGQTRVKQMKDSVVVFTAQVVDTTTRSSVATVTVSPDSTVIGTDTTIDLDATARDGNGDPITGLDVLWSSSDTTIARVDAQGLVSPIRPGQITVSATVDGVTGIATVAVVSSGTGTLTILPADTLDGVGDTLTLTVEARTQDGAVISSPDIQWSSNDTSIATVDAMGHVTARSVGIAVIAASAACCSGDSQGVVVADTPARVDDLVVAGVGPDSVTLQWTQVDDGAGNPAGYSVRYGSPSLDWGSAAATEVTVEGTAIGQPITQTFPGLSANTLYEFGVVSYRGTLGEDAVFGPLSSTVSETTGQDSVPGRVVLFEEGFEDGEFAARDWYDNTGLTLTTAEHVSGSGALEIHFQDGGVLPTFGGAARHLFGPSQSVYVSFWIKYSANWEGSGHLYHPHLFQILTNEDGPYVGPAETRLTTYIESNYQNGVIPVLAMADRSNIDQSRAGEDLTNITEDRAAAGCNGEADGYPTGCWQNGGVWWNEKVWKADQVYFTDEPGARYKNDWHFVEVYFELNTIQDGIGLPDGTARYWYDGALAMDLQGVLFRTGAHPDMGFNQFVVGPYIGDGSPVPQTIWIDDLTVANMP